MVLEAMGLQLPGNSFINPDTPLREAITTAAAEHVAKIARTGRTPACGRYHRRAEFCPTVSLRCWPRAVQPTSAFTSWRWRGQQVWSSPGLILTRCQVTPLLAKIYPNGSADINHFQAAGGTGLLFGELIKAGLMHGDARVGFGGTLESCVEPFLEQGELRWRPATEKSHDPM